MIISKVIYFLESDIDSGKANVIQTISMANSIAQLGIEVRIIGSISNKYKHPNVIKSILGDDTSILVELTEKKVYFRKAQTISRFLGTAKTLARSRIKVSDPNQIFVTRSALLAIYLLLKRGRVVLECHNTAFINSFTLNELLTRIIRRLNTQKRLILVVISQQLQQYFVDKQFINSNILVQHDAVDTEFFTQENSVIDNIPEEFLVDPNSYDLIATYSGSVYLDRNIELLIRTAHRVKSILFCVVGGPNESIERLRKEIEIPQNIIFTGQKPYMDVPRYIFNSDILLGIWSPLVRTINYCSPLKIFEYLTTNKLIICEDYPSIREVLIDNQNCILFEPGNENELVSILKKVLANEKLLGIGNGNYSYVQSNFSYLNRAKHLIEFNKVFWTTF